MTAPGMVHFDAPKEAVLHAGIWITAHGPYDRQAPGWPAIEAIGNKLIKSSARRGKSPHAQSITLSLKRSDARWLARNGPKGVSTILSASDPIAEHAREVSYAALRALRRRPGQPPLTASEIASGMTRKGKKPAKRTRSYRNTRQKKQEAAKKAPRPLWLLATSLLAGSRAPRASALGLPTSTILTGTEIPE